MNKQHISRRDFLKLVLDGLLIFGGLLGLEGIIRFLGYKSESPEPTEFDLGPVENYLLDSKTILSEVPAVLIHDANGFRALSLVCTHLGCTIQLQTDKFACPCHGSQFNFAGNPIKGPATTALENLRVEETSDGRLILHTAE